MSSHSLAWADLRSRQIGERAGSGCTSTASTADCPPTVGSYGYLAHRTAHTRSDGAVRLCPQGCAAGECEAALRHRAGKQWPYRPHPLSGRPETHGRAVKVRGPRNFSVAVFSPRSPAGASRTNDSHGPRAAVEPGLGDMFG